MVADDLANLAKTMRRSLEHQTDGENADAAANAIAIPLQRVDQPEETQVSPMQATETSRTEKPNTTEPAASAPVQETPRRFPVVQARREPMRSTAPEADAATAEAVARLQESVAKLESRPVDQWLERRLREFERALESLQNNRSERSTSNNSVEERLQRLRESVEAVDMRHAMAADETARAVGERFDGADRRLRETLSDLQAEAVHLARRITALENLAFASRPEAMPIPATFEPVSEAAPPPMLEQPHEETSPADDAARASNDAAPSYLAAARRSAQAAAARANEEHRRTAVARKPKKTLLYAVCAFLGSSVLVLIVAGFILRNSSMNAEPVAVAAKPVRAHIARMTVVTPLPHVAAKAPRVLPASPQSTLIKLAETGDPSAELLVGLNYLEGKGLPRNEAAAVDWLSRAAAKGQPVAQYDLGALYADGRGVPADSVQAFQWFGAAALRGNRRAMHFLAIAYAEGVGTAKAT